MASTSSHLTGADIAGFPMKFIKGSYILFMAVQPCLWQGKSTDIFPPLRILLLHLTYMLLVPIPQRSNYQGIQISCGEPREK